MRKLTLFALMMVAFISGSFVQAEYEIHYFNQTDFKDGYYLAPKNLPDSYEKMWVLVNVHGAGGLKGESKGHWLLDMADSGQAILIVPSFTDGYQGGDGEWASQMLKNFEEVQEKYSVHDRMFIHGFSGGSQFAHRFTMNHPKSVIACSAHSGGSWACDGGYGKISSKAKGVPFFISCGEGDSKHSGPGALFTRIEWYNQFYKHISSKGFTVLGKTWPGVAHQQTRDMRPHILELFQLATQGEKPETEGWVGNIEEIASAARAAGGSGSLANKNNDNDSVEFDGIEMVRKANDAIKAGQVPDTISTLRFLVNQPAKAWAGHSEFSSLKEHCQKVAQAYLNERSSSGNALTGDTLEKFQQSTEGLDLGDSKPLPN